jgi:hypothetical protein
VDNELEVIRDEMEQTRANLADKLGALETTSLTPSTVELTASVAPETVSRTWFSSAPSFSARLARVISISSRITSSSLSTRRSP